jgi:hypothetical protein
LHIASSTSDLYVTFAEFVTRGATLIAQGAAMCTEDAVVLAELVTSDEPVDQTLAAGYPSPRGTPLPVYAAC